jgi:hypothetical protein
MAILITIRDHISAHCDTADEAATILAGLACAPLTAAVRAEPAAPKALPAPAKTTVKTSAPNMNTGVSARLRGVLALHKRVTTSEAASLAGCKLQQARDLLGYLRKRGEVDCVDGVWAPKKGA